MRKIILPTDFSDNALHALHFATELFKYEKVEFLIIHAYASQVYSEDTFYSESILNKIKKEVEEECLEKLKIIEMELVAFSPNPRHRYRTEAVFGLLIDVVEDFANDEDVDLVVLGTRGATNDRKHTYGSNALQILKYITPPVLTIPEKFEYTQPKDILFVTDFMLPYKKRELKLLSTLSKSYRGKIQLLYLSDYERLSNRQMENKAFLEAILHENELELHIIKGSTIPEAAQKFISDYQIDLLVMVNSRHSYIESILYQSAIETIELNFKIPFLVMQNIKRS